MNRVAQSVSTWVRGAEGRGSLPRMVSLVRLECPSCGAPLRVDPGQRVVLCTYCNGSARVVHDEGGGSDTLTRDEGVPAELVESVKSEVLAGRRDAAVRRYASATGVPLADAATAVDQMVGYAVLQRMKYAPLRPHGFVMFGAFVAVPWALVGVAVGSLADGFSVGWALAAAVGAVLGLIALRTFVRHTVGSWVSSFGATGRALVRRSALLQTVSGGSNVQLLFEVTPDRGGETFLHETVCALADTSRAKLVPGNVVRVRIGLGGRLVFPATPVEVLSGPGAPSRAA